MEPLDCTAQPGSGNFATISITSCVIPTVEPKLPVKYWASLPEEVLAKVRPSAVPAPAGLPTTLRLPVLWAPAFAMEPEEIGVVVKSIFTTSETVADPWAGIF
jgi:hypothetical protein